MSSRRCAAKTCFNLQGCRPNLKFFPFPKDLPISRQWAFNCGRTDVIDKPIEQLSKLLICADHFESHWFLNPKYKTVFVRTGQPIPTIFHNNLADFVPKSLKKHVESRIPRENGTDVSITEEETKLAEEDCSSSEETSLIRKHGCHKMCRLCACLVYEDNLISIFGEDSQHQDLLIKINRLLPDNVDAEDGLPHHVCGSCVSKVNECNDIVDSFLTADRKLRHIFQNSHSVPQGLTYITLQEDFEQQPASPSFDSKVIVAVDNAILSENSLRDAVNDECPNVFDASASGGVVSASVQEVASVESFAKVERDDYSLDFLESQDEKLFDDGSSDGNDKTQRVYMCLVCRKIFKEKDKLLMHEIAEHAAETKDHEFISHKKYKRRETHLCSECGTGFPGLKPLKRHIREIHIPAENICEYCGAHYKIKSQLDVHRRLHTDEKPFTCTVCNESFHFKKAFKRHKRVHVEPKSLTCSVCSKTFSNRSAMWRHEQIHSTSRSVLCYLCGKVLSNSQSLRVHMKTHSTDRPCSCPICGKTFRDNISVNKHMVMHSSVKNFKCDVCGRAFYSKGLVKQHKLSHSGVKPYKCEVCGAAFNRLGNLNQHKKKHLQDGTIDHIRPNLNHMCVVCGKLMKSELTLKYHLAKHTGEKKPFDCEVCGKRFVAVDPYRVHMRIHTGERPYECSVCEKTFRSAFTLKQHSALHKDEFPYPCTFCERRFKRLQSLIVHKRTHTGEKPHLCPICGRGFAQRGDMMKHTKTHNRDSRERRDRKQAAMELEHITELVLSDTEITSEFLIDMPIVEVETEMNNEMHAQIQTGFPSQMQTEIDADLKSQIASQIRPVIAAGLQANIHSGIGSCIQMQIQSDIHPDISTGIACIQKFTL